MTSQPVNAEWIAGDPLEAPGTWQMSLPMFDVRDEDDHIGGAAARWPQPMPWHEIGDDA